MDNSIDDYTTENIEELVYLQVEHLLTEGDMSAKYPIVDDWYIKWDDDENDESEYSNNIWEQNILLYKGEKRIGRFYIFQAAMTYADLARGDYDFISLVSCKIAKSIENITNFDKMSKQSA